MQKKKNPTKQKNNNNKTKSISFIEIHLPLVFYLISGLCSVHVHSFPFYIYMCICIIICSEPFLGTYIIMPFTLEYFSVLPKNRDFLIYTHNFSALSIRQTHFYPILFIFLFCQLTHWCSSPPQYGIQPKLRYYINCQISLASFNLEHFCSQQNPATDEISDCWRAGLPGYCTLSGQAQSFWGPWHCSTCFSSGLRGPETQGLPFCWIRSWGKVEQSYKSDKSEIQPRDTEGWLYH